jgi:hypothetical protein
MSAANSDGPVQLVDNTIGQVLGEFATRGEANKIKASGPSSHELAVHKIEAETDGD